MTDKLTAIFFLCTAAIVWASSIVYEGKRVGNMKSAYVCAGLVAAVTAFVTIVILNVV